MSWSLRVLGASSLIVSMAGMATVSGALAQASQRDRIGEMLRRPEASGSRTAQTAPYAQPAKEPADQAANGRSAPPEALKDPREGDPAFEQSQRLMRAVDAILQDAAKQRGEAAKLPSDKDFLLKPIWTESREDREKKIRDLLDAVMGIVTDVPIVDVQKRIESHRKSIRDLDDRLVKLKEKQLTAPKEGMLPGVITDTVDSLARDIEDTEKRIAGNKGQIQAAKEEVHTALQRSGIQMRPEQIDLLLDGVLSGDLVRLVAVFNSAKLIDGQLAKMLAASGENVGAARRYFAMHAALFAMLVHAQTSLIDKIDKGYLPKLDAIVKDLGAARTKTNDLLRAENRADQKRALEANRESQRLAEEAAKGYRRYLLQQREQIARARSRTTHDLKIADNTFETVEASFQLRNLMRDSTTSFEAIQKLEAPTFEQIFRNEELRREFENLTKRLEVPSS